MFHEPTLVWPPWPHDPPAGGLDPGLLHRDEVWEAVSWHDVVANEQHTLAEAGGGAGTDRKLG